eukprot:TRINITY_DN38718_c0_g1_i1.p1 TRINITY_DN38718_c0_g1~~TRINITY_DN38718_c0_g1_i1.p1  ORF type:complete len:646 (+),score=149.67 TRINITY_DN38718_c0_g1_i1:75-1940(+)
MAVSSQDLLDPPMENEVTFARMEGRLRDMILETLKPTIHRATRLQTCYEDLTAVVDGIKDKLQELGIVAKHAGGAADLVVVLQTQLAQAVEHHDDMVRRMDYFEKVAKGRMELIERDVELQKVSCDRLGRSIERATEEMTGYDVSLKNVQQQMDASLQRQRDNLTAELKRLDLSLKDLAETQRVTRDEIWGEEDCAELSPPSLRRLDRQARRLDATLVEALAEIGDLRRLDNEMLALSGRQANVEERLTTLNGTSIKLEKNVDRMALEQKADMKRTSNLMAAFSANLLKEARSCFGDSQSTADTLRHDVESFVEQTRASIGKLDNSLRTTSAQVEAMLREIHVDIENLDSRRKHDKGVTDDSLRSLARRCDEAFQSSDSTLRGLETVALVVNMALQCEQMSTLMDAQDHAERTESAFVGVPADSAAAMEKKTAEPTGRRSRLMAESFSVLPYKPKALTFAGTSLERPQLLALREKLLVNAREALQRGPLMEYKKSDGGGPSGAKGMPAPPQLSEVLGDAAAFPSRPAFTRSGSRGQPSARGSPVPFEHGGSQEALGSSRSGTSAAHRESAENIPLSSRPSTSTAATTRPNTAAAPDNMLARGSGLPKLAEGRGRKQVPAAA